MLLSIDIIGQTEKTLDFAPHKCPPFYERLREIMAAKNISYYRFVNDTRFKENFIDQWKKGADPHIATLIELAAYFDCTVDFLVGRER